MSLALKIDEAHAGAQTTCPDFICITETWLQSHIHSNFVELNSYNFIRKDKPEGIHGVSASIINIPSRYSVISGGFVGYPTRLPRVVLIQSL